MKTKGKVLNATGSKADDGSTMLCDLVVCVRCDRDQQEQMMQFARDKSEATIIFGPTPEASKNKSTDREREKCAQACENMIAHHRTWDPDRKFTTAEALLEAARRIRAGEFGPVDLIGWEKP